MGAGPLVVTYPLTGRSRAIVEEELGGTAEAIYLVDLAPAARAQALEHAGAVRTLAAARSAETRRPRSGAPEPTLISLSGDIPAPQRRRAVA